MEEGDLTGTEEYEGSLRYVADYDIAQGGEALWPFKDITKFQKTLQDSYDELKKDGLI